MRYGFFAVMIPAIAYTVFYIELTIWMFLLWTVYTIYFAWFFLLFFKAARVAAGASRGKAAVFATGALLSFQSVLLIFIR
ncbi:MAG: hypothetical protein IPP94_13940 [Ignavibacteria bacterium]|nr:hypothetical protein [Ignavibacteria bacterium]